MSNPFSPSPSRPRLRLLPSVLTQEMERFFALGLGVSALRFEDALALLLEAPHHSLSLRVHFASIHTLIEAAREAELRDALNQADVLAPEGASLVWLGRLMGKRLDCVRARELMLAVLDRARVPGFRHFFYGGSAELVESLVPSLSERLPGIEIAGVYAPPVRPLAWREVDEVARLINAARPDYVWVGLDSPQQDYWLASFRPLLHAPVLLAVGDAFQQETARPAQPTT